MDAETVIANWAKWCLDHSGIYPATPTNWQMMEQVEYKNCHDTLDEKLEKLIAAQPIDERGAERTELWIGQFPPLIQQAVRTHYVYMPDFQRQEWHCDQETWQARRAAWCQRRLRELGQARAVTVEAYEAAVNEGLRQIGECLVMFARGV